MNVTCNQCGYSASIAAVQIHNCQIQEQGGRCEDFPACGHTDGDGCQTRLEHTSDYWLQMYSEFPEAMEDAGHWDY